MCYNSAAAAKASAIHALRSGILILMIPPVLLFGAFTLMAIRRRNTFNDVSGSPDSSDEAEHGILAGLEEIHWPDSEGAGQVGVVSYQVQESVGRRVDGPAISKPSFQARQ
jgi:hypothetical protein